MVGALFTAYGIDVVEEPLCTDSFIISVAFSKHRIRCYRFYLLVHVLPSLSQSNIAMGTTLVG